MRLWADQDRTRPAGSMRWGPWCLSACLLMLLVWPHRAPADEDDWMIYLGDSTAPRAPQRQVSAAEALPPLPLPATPLRRTERKKPPQPDYLLGKVIWGQAASFTDSSGQVMQIADWNLCPTDLPKLMEAIRQAELYFHWSNINLNDFHFDSGRLPALLVSGVRTFRLDEASRKRLRQYLVDGGMVICDSIAGSPYFYQSVKAVFQEMFPESPFRVLPPDHPIYHMYFDIESVVRPGKDDLTEPRLEGIYIGSRAGVILSRSGLGCGWNRNLEKVAILKDAEYFDVAGAQQLGVNLALYIVGYAQAGLAEGRPEWFALADQQAPTDEFVFAQIRHNGHWNVHPAAATNLLLQLRRQTSVRVNCRRRAVDLDTDDVSSYPFLYLTGLDDFTLSARGVTALQRFLRSGGILLINNGLGLSRFDRAVRRELARVVPAATFQRIQPSDPLFDCLFACRSVQYTPAVAGQADDAPTQPYLLGITVDAEWRVLYSPYDLEAGWLDACYPLMKGYQGASARRLGMNIITYIMTH